MMVQMNIEIGVLCGSESVFITDKRNTQHHIKGKNEWLFKQAILNILIKMCLWPFLSRFHWFYFHFLVWYQCNSHICTPIYTAINLIKLAQFVSVTVHFIQNNSENRCSHYRTADRSEGSLNISILDIQSCFVLTLIRQSWNGFVLCAVMSIGVTVKSECISWAVTIKASSLLSLSFRPKKCLFIADITLKTNVWLCIGQIPIHSLNSGSVSVQALALNICHRFGQRRIAVHTHSSLNLSLRCLWQKWEKK